MPPVRLTLRQVAWTLDGRRLSHVIRSYREEDRSSVETLLVEAWPDDQVLREISSIHGEHLDTVDRWRRSLVSLQRGEVTAVGTLLAGARHPTRIFVVIAVAPAYRRRGIGSALLAELRRLSDGRPLLARVREDDPIGLGFADAHGFDVVMRSRVGVVDPADRRVEAWVAANSALVVDRDLSRKELAVAHEAAYRAEHESWSPVPRRPLAESLRLFCGDSWLRETAVAVRSESRIRAVAALHGPPLAPSENELFLIAGSASHDAAALRTVVAAELDLARSSGAVLSIEADEANAALSVTLAELPATLEPTLLLVSTDALPLG